MQADLLNHGWIESGGDGTPDCGHETCGIQCDVAILQRRPGGAVRELAADFNLQSAAGRRPERQASILGLLGQGMGLRQVATFLEVPLTEVLRSFTERPLIASWLGAEELLHEGRSYAAIAKATGLPDHAVARLAGAMGIVSPCAERQASGGSVRYTAAQLAEVRELRATGLSYAKVGVLTGIPARTVEHIVKRAA